MGSAALSVPWLVIVALAGSGPPAIARLLAAGIGALVAMLLERGATHRHQAIGRHSAHRRAYLLLPVVAFACGASISVTVAGAIAGLAGIGGMTMMLSCRRHHPS